jgi:hypothetical protein
MGFYGKDSEIASEAAKTPQKLYETGTSKTSRIWPIFSEIGPFNHEKKVYLIRSDGDKTPLL